VRLPMSKTGSSGDGSSSRPRKLLLLGCTGALFAAAAPSPAAEVLVTNASTHVWGQPLIAVNPKNPNNIVMAIMGIAFTKECRDKAAKDPKSPCADMEVIPMGNVKTRPIGMITNVPGFTMATAWASFDGGKTWARTAEVKEGGNVPVLPTKQYVGPILSDRHGVTAAPDGSFYIAWDATRFANVPYYSDFGGIPYSKSTDGGRTWSEPAMTGSTLDGGRLVTDLATGTIYTSSSGTPGPNPLSLGDPKVLITNDPPTGMDRHIVFTRNSGVTWSKPIIIGGGNESLGAAHGLLATAFKTTGEQDYLNVGRSNANNNLCGNAPKPCTIFQVAKNGGAWTRSVMSIPISYGGQPAVVANPTKPGHFALMVSEKSGTELHVYRTQDSGKTWSKPTIVTDAPGKVPTGTWIEYGPTGVLGIAWKSRNAPPPGQAGGQGGGQGGQNRSPYNVMAAISRDGGATFSRPLKINGAESPPPPPDAGFSLSRDGGAYIALTSDNAYVAWSDWKTGEGKVMFNAVKIGDFR